MILYKAKFPPGIITASSFRLFDPSGGCITILSLCLSVLILILFLMESVIIAGSMQNNIAIPYVPIYFHIYRTDHNKSIHTLICEYIHYSLNKQSTEYIDINIHKNH